MHPSSPSLLRDRPLLWACLAPMALICLCLALFGVDVLFWDEWTIWVGLLEHIKEGSLSLSSLVAQQNEQRNLAARAFGLLFMPVFKLNRFPEFAVMVLMTLGSFLLLTRMWSHTRSELSLTGGRWLPVAVSALLFSTLQWQLFSFGVNTSISMTILTMILGAALMQPGRLEAWRVALLIVIGWAGSFNFANALFYWICLPPLMLLSPSGKKRKAVAVTVFLIAGVAAWGAYFHGYVKPEHHPSLFYAFSKPFSFVGFVFAYLGAPLVSDGNLLVLSILGGLGAAALMAVSLCKLRSQARTLLFPLAPWLSLTLFALLSDGATAVGRAGFGMHQALQSRYITFANLFWCALLVIWAVAREKLPQNENTRKLQRHAKRFLIGCLCVFVLGSILAIAVFVQRKERLQAGREALFSMADNAPVKGIFPDPNYLRKHLPLFFERRLSVYRDIRELQDYRPTPPEKGAAGRVSTVLVRGPGSDGDMPSGVLFKGQAAPLKIGGDMPRYVLFVSGGRILFAAKPDEKNGSFEAFIPTDWFDSPQPSIMPLAVSQDGETAMFMEMPGEDTIDLPEPWYPPFVIDQYFYAE